MHFKHRVIEVHMLLLSSEYGILPSHRFVYQYFEREPLPGAESGKYRFETKNWCPEDLCLQQIAESLTLNVSIPSTN